MSGDTSAEATTESGTGPAGSGTTGTTPAAPTTGSGGSGHSTRQAIMYCPYCAEETLFPLEGGGWECRSCLRAFSISFLGLRPARTGTGS